MQLTRNNGTLAIMLISSLIGCGGVGEAASRSKQFVRGNAQSGSSVDAHEVDANGQAVPESNPSSTSTADATGDYSVEVNVHSGASAAFVVESTLGSVRQACIVESTFNTSADVVAEPMTAETTYESNLFVNALAEGKMCDGCNAASVLDWVGEHSADAYAASSTAAALDSSTDATTTAVAAHHAALVAQASSGATSINAAETAHIAARLDRAAALDAAMTPSQMSAAEASYSASLKAAYTSAGVTLDEQSAAAQAASEAATSRVDQDSTLSATLEAALRADVELVRADAVTTAVAAHASATGTSMGTLDASRASLESSLASAATGGAAATAQLDAAWDAYRASVEAAVRATLSAPEQLAFDAAVLAIAGQASSAHATLDASVASSVNISGWVMPALTFLASGNAQVDSLTMTGISAAKAEAIVHILVALEFAAG